jgi:hypothetical protein
MAAISQLLWNLFDFAFELLASLSIVSPREKTEPRDKWAAVAMLLLIVGGLAVLVAMILTLSHLRR